LAATDATKATQARLAAQAARDIAHGASKAADAANAAGNAAREVYRAAQWAADASHHAAASADAAAQAGNFADSAGADASVARAAAARAKANALRASRAAQAAMIFANIAAVAAFASRDAANRAAANAISAAAAAEKAADHAGEAAEAAERSTAHANAATAAAEAAMAASLQAKNVYDAARKADAERIRISFEQGQEAALAAAGEVKKLENKAAWDSEAAARLSADTKRLITEANDPATPRSDAISKARQVALTLATADGSWTRTAAEEALTGDDALALEYVRTGVQLATGQDNRATLAGLMVTGTAALRAAAKAALDGTDAEVANFLKTMNYPERVTEDRLKVNQLLAAAQAAGDAAMIDQAQRALDNGTGEALRDFLQTGQYVAAAADQRVKVNQVLSSPDSGPELKAAAQIALDGPPAFLEQFLSTQRYSAAQRDQDTAAHDAVVATLLTKAAEVATIAILNALDAQAVAAKARGAAAEAAGYALQAAEAATKAAGYAKQAQLSAEQAQESASRAAVSANTAVNAAAAAAKSAKKAGQAALWAQVSAQHAAQSASSAYGSSVNAYKSALKATQNAQLALDAYRDAIGSANAKAIIEIGNFAVELSQQCRQQGIDLEACLANVGKLVEDPARVAYINANTCAKFFQPGSGPYKTCVANVLNPNFGQNLELTLFSIPWHLTAGMFGVMAVAAWSMLAGYALGAALAACVGLCAVLVEAVGVMTSPELIGLPMYAGIGVYGGGLLGVRALALMERAAVAAMGGKAHFARMISIIKLCGQRNSFPAGTAVRMADGTDKPIEDVRAGDRVLSTDPVTSETDGRPVSATITGQGTKKLVDVTIDTDGPGGDETASVTATGKHPFWVANLGAWMDAAKLQPGQWLRTGTGTWVQITQIQQRTEPSTVHNLTVPGYQTYYVTAGTTTVLVHNTCPTHQWPTGPRPLDPLPVHLRWHPSHGTPIIGRFDRVNSDAYAGYARLNIDPWDLQRNDAWIQSIINQKQPVRIVLDDHGVWNPGSPGQEGDASVTLREIHQLIDQGYRWVGDWLLPPP
jgi:hypothetical protein